MLTLKRTVLSLVFFTGLVLLNGCADRTEKAKAISSTYSPLRECAVSGRQVNLAWEDTYNEQIRRRVLSFCEETLFCFIPAKNGIFDQLPVSSIAIEQVSSV